jgi:predicted transglutaminase-like cysteine proteinase
MPSAAHPACPPLTAFERMVEAQMMSFNPAAPPPKPIEAFGIEELRNFCKPYRRPHALICTGGAGKAPTLNEVRQVDAALRAQFEYRLDILQFADEDIWDDDTLCGDCEDYALTLATRLHKAGAGGHFMRLMIWEPVPGAGHATLLVQTADAGEVEIGVGPDSEGPHPYDAKKGRRFGAIRFDGRQELIPEPGYGFLPVQMIVGELRKR